jgi:diaminobutyrate-2-oxoglutarate transaminase
MEIINQLESNVRSYVRSFPTVFNTAEGSTLVDMNGRVYLDFFAGAGTLNYGHNNPVLRDELLQYIASSGITHSLDMATRAKCEFLETFQRNVLRPRDLRYKVMFPGPTGTNAVEAALKLARKVTGRTNVIAFTNGFHGMTLGSLAATANGGKRGGAGLPLHGVTRAPFDGYYADDVNPLTHLDMLLSDKSSGVDAPAAFIVETVQGEGGVNVASWTWLRGLADLAREHGALLIVDDIQVGCGRVGSFFSFEEAGLSPDIITLSKSLSGFGLPFALTLINPEIDIFAPGEHNGTFRGFNYAFVTARAAIDEYWADDHLCQEVDEKAAIMSAALARIADQHGAEHRGRGMIQGLAFEDVEIASAASRAAFERGLIIETSGSDDEVLKLLPPLTISHPELRQGLDIIAEAVLEAVDELDASAEEGAEARIVLA